MKICLVTTFPPSRGGLNEYGLHVAQALTNLPQLNLTILADKLRIPETEMDGFHVIRCWLPFPFVPFRWARFKLGVRFTPTGG